MGCRRDSVAMQGLGYKEILDYLDEHGVDVLRQKDADALEDLEEEELDLDDIEIL